MFFLINSINLDMLELGIWSVQIILGTNHCFVYSPQLRVQIIFVSCTVPSYVYKWFLFRVQSSATCTNYPCFTYIPQIRIQTLLVLRTIISYVYKLSLFTSRSCYVHACFCAQSVPKTRYLVHTYKSSSTFSFQAQQTNKSRVYPRHSEQQSLSS